VSDNLFDCRIRVDEGSIMRREQQNSSLRGTRFGVAGDGQSSFHLPAPQCAHPACRQAMGTSLRERAPSLSCLRVTPERANSFGLGSGGSSQIGHFGEAFESSKSMAVAMMTCQETNRVVKSGAAQPISALTSAFIFS
jgi:hypothetical protein